MTIPSPMPAKRPGRGAGTRRPRRRIKWGSRPRKDIPVPAGPPPEAPGFLGRWGWRQPGPLERTEDWLARTSRQRQAVIAGAANWLRPGQRVKVHHDPRAGGGDVSGRVGTVYRLCGPPFADYAYVHFAPQGRERVPRVRMLPLEILEPVE